MDDSIRMTYRCCLSIARLLLPYQVAIGAEPNPASVVKDANDVAAVIGFDRFGRHGELTDVESGSLLIAELNCIACHSSANPQLQPRLGPNLSGAGNRLQSDWMRRYLQEPHQVDPGTTMPNVLASIDENQRAATIEALTAFLQTQQRAYPEIKAGGASPVVESRSGYFD